MKKHKHHKTARSNKRKSHASKSSGDHILRSRDRQGAHILVFAAVIIIAFALFSATTDFYPGNSAAEGSAVHAPDTRANIAGQAWGSVSESFDGVIVEGYGYSDAQPTERIVRFCSGRYCSYRTCQWGDVKVAGPGCLMFAYDIKGEGCAYGIAEEGETITKIPSSLNVMFRSGDAGARSLMDEEWRASRGTYECDNNKWVYRG